jgi:transcriptional regulator with XRE-family HTH domain
MIGYNLYNARLESGLSQRKLADCIGQDVSAVSRWENDKRAITVDNLKSMCEALNVSADEILEIKLNK